MRTAILLIMILSASTVSAHWGEWPENDQRQGQCEFSDWSRFAFVQSVYDGDTITVTFDLGFDIMQLNQKIRFYGVNASEIRNKDLADKALGIEARDWLRKVVLGKWVVLTTIRDGSGKYGRTLGTVCRDGRDVIGEMLDLGLTQKAEY